MLEEFLMRWSRSCEVLVLNGSGWTSTLRAALRWIGQASSGLADFSERITFVNLTAGEFEGLLVELGARGVTLTIQVERRALGDRGSWQILVSGGTAPDDGIRVKGSRSFEECIQTALRKLCASPGDWAWPALCR